VPTRYGPSVAKISCGKIGQRQTATLSVVYSRERVRSDSVIVWHLNFAEPTNTRPTLPLAGAQEALILARSGHPAPPIFKRLHTGSYRSESAGPSDL
jgi:hypothetical protein